MKNDNYYSYRSHVGRGLVSERSIAIDPIPGKSNGDLKVKIDSLRLERELKRELDGPLDEL